MKKKALVAFVLMAFTLGTAVPTQAQLTKEQRKERKELSKMTKSEVESKSSKVARKEAKKLQGEGWTTCWE